MARILVADDDRDIRELVEFKLKSLGHGVVVATNGTDAWEQLLAQPFDIAVLDGLMPGLSGIEIIQRIRDEPRLTNLMIVLLSGRATPADVDAGLAAGANAYVVKPFSPRQLGDIVGSLLAS